MSPDTDDPAAAPDAESDGPTAHSRVDLHELYDSHWHSLVRLAVLLVDDVASAEDVVQDAFVALHRNSAGLREPDAAVGYLRTSVMNLSRSVLRRRGVARKHLRVAEPEAIAGADDHVMVREEHREALQAVRGLPRHQREVLVLRYWSDLSEREIAETLGISAGAVKSAASRGMASLSKTLGAQASGGTR